MFQFLADVDALHYFRSVCLKIGEKDDRDSWQRC